MDLGYSQGSEQRGPRPVLVVSDNLLNRSSPVVIVAPLTGAAPKRHYPHDVSVPPGTVSPRPGRVLCGQIRTVSKQRLGRRLGILPDRLMNQVDEALRLVLDL